MKDMSSSSQENFQRKRDSSKRTDLDYFSHQLFELSFDSKVIEYLCNQSELYSLSKNKFTLKVNDEIMK